LSVFKFFFSSFSRAQEIFKDALSAKELRLGILKGSNVSVGDREEMAVEGGYDKEMAVEGDDKENRRDAANHLKSKSNRYFDASTSTTGKTLTTSSKSYRDMPQLPDNQSSKTLL
jgi:hypothetical protein